MAQVTLEVSNLVSFTEAARILGLSRQSIYKWIDRGKLHPISIGQNRYLLRVEVENSKKATTVVKPS